MGLLRAMIEYMKEDEGNDQQTVNDDQEKQPTENDTVNTPQVAESPPLVSFVATDLDLRTERLTGGQDIERDGKVYRQLDPEYFAWLRSRMVQARSLRESGKLSNADWNVLRSRFNNLQEIAINVFGKDALEDAVRKFNQKTYTPPTVAKNETVPVPHVYPGDQTYKFTQPVTHNALAKVNAIRDEAISKGWSEAKLYQNQGRFKFPCGQDYGLICFLDDDCETGEVTDKSIEIIHGSRRSVLKYYNPDVDQPWIRRLSNGS